MERIALIAGNGTFPLVFAQAARSQNVDVFAVAIKEEADPALAQYVERIHWISVGQFTTLLRILREEKATQAVMVGQIRHKLLFSEIELDDALAELLRTIKDKKTDTILGAVAARISQLGIEVIDSSSYIKHCLISPGVLTRRQPTQAEQEDVAFGFGIAKAIAGLDIGQTVVVKDKVVLSVEAIEGTDEAIRRAHTYCHAGAVVVKVSKPNQDMRFDIPLIGKRTVDTLIAEEAAVLAVEAGKTLLLDREYVLSQADRHSICIVAVL